MLFRDDRLSNQTNSLSQNSSQILPVTVHNRSSRFLSSTLPKDFYSSIPSVNDHPSKPLNSEVPYGYSREEKKTQLRSQKSDQQHDEKMKGYDRLLERIRTTDEQLHRLSQSWMTSTRERMPVSNDYFSPNEIFQKYEKEFFRWLISGRSQSKIAFEVE